MPTSANEDGRPTQGGAALPVHIMNPGSISGGGGGGGPSSNVAVTNFPASQAVTIADGADVAEGVTTDAAVVTDANGTISGKLRGLVKWAFERMPASLGQKAMAAAFPVSIASDQSALPVTGTFFQGTQPVSVADGADVAQGVTTGAAVVTDANGTIQQYLRGLVKLIVAKINVKIADGDDAAEGITTGAAVVTDANGTLQGYLRGLVKLWIAGLAAGEAHIGAVGGNSNKILVTPTLTVAATYVSGDYVGTSGTAMVFAGAGRVAAGTGVILSATFIDYALQSVACELWLFTTAITPPADSAAWSISDADALNLVTVIPFSTYYASALNSVAPAKNIGDVYKCAGGDTNLYGCIVTRGAPTYANGNVNVVIKVLQD